MIGPVKSRKLSSTDILSDTFPPFQSAVIETGHSALSLEGVPDVTPDVEELRDDLASTTEADKGAGLVGYGGALAYGSGTVGQELRERTVRGFATRAAMAAYITSNGVLSGAEYRADNLSYIGSPGATLIADLPGLVPAVPIRPEHFTGAPPSDTAIEAASEVAAGLDQDAQLSASEYNVGSLNLDGGLRGIGPGSHLIRNLPHGGGGNKYLIVGPGGSRYEDFSIELLPGINGNEVVYPIDPNVSNLILDRMILDGGVVLDEDGDDNYRANLGVITNSAGARTGYRMSFSTVRKFFWGILKANNIVSTEKDISYLFNEFDEMGSVYLIFNSPAAGALTENVLILGNKLGSVLSKQPFDGAKPGYPHRGSFAGHVEYAKFIANHATGYGGELFRSEEAARAVIMALNTARLNGKDGIEIIPNNAGGTLYTPRLFLVTGNILDHRGLVAAPTLGWGLAAHVYDTIPGHEAAEALHDSIIHGNLTQGFQWGLQLHKGMRRNLIGWHISVDEQVGLRTWSPSLGTKDILITDPTTAAVHFERGGMLEGPIHHRSKAQVPPPAAAIARTPESAPGDIKNQTWESGLFEFPAGFKEYPAFHLGRFMDAEIEISIASSAARYGFERGHVHWDGTTLTYQRIARHVFGSIVPSNVPIGHEDGSLVLRFFNDGAATQDTCVQAKLTGMCITS